jgi:hypothetical protein
VQVRSMNGIIRTAIRTGTVRPPQSTLFEPSGGST